MSRENQVESKIQISVDHSDAESGLQYHSHSIYREMEDHPVSFMDELALLNQNIMVLEDLQKRMSFVMKEVRYMMKVD